jgi:predicted ester cyclase
VADELIATDLVLRNPPSITHGLDDYKQGMAAFHAAFPDLHFTVEDQIAEKDRVAVRWTADGKIRELCAVALRCGWSWK